MHLTKNSQLYNFLNHNPQYEMFILRAFGLYVNGETFICVGWMFLVVEINYWVFCKSPSAGIVVILEMYVGCRKLETFTFSASKIANYKALNHNLQQIFLC